MKNENEQMVNGVPHRLLDGADELPEVSPDRVEQLMAGAPDHIKTRAEQFAKDRGGQKAQ